MSKVVPWLDPTLDVIFKLLLTRRQELLRDMLQCVLGRPVRVAARLDSDVHGSLASGKRVTFDIRAVLDDDSRVDLEMQRRATVALKSRLVYYAARDYADQLDRGDSYHLLTPTTGIAWLGEVVLPEVERLHSVFELRERHTNIRLSQQLTLHLLQLPLASAKGQTNRYTRGVELWARFFRARDDNDFATLASEDPIMRVATRTLAQLSQDPKARLLARRREDELKLHRVDIATSEAQAQARMLLKLLRARFGSLPELVVTRVHAASCPRLETWGERLLTARTLDDVFAR